MEGSVLEPDDLWTYKYPAGVLLRGQWGTDGATVYFRCF